METTLTFNDTTSLTTVTVTPRESITLDVAYHYDRERGARRVQTYRVGEAAAYDGFNLTYIGTIKAIGLKTVTIEDGSARRRLTFARFAFWNRESVAEHQEGNARWSD